MNSLGKIIVAPGVVAAIYVDESPENPWESWDGCHPLIARTSRGLANYGDPPTPGDLIRLIPEWRFRSRKMVHYLAERLETYESLLDIERNRPRGKTPLPKWRKENLEELVCEMERPSGYAYSDAYLNTLQDLAHIARIPTARVTVRGYCQGDWADLLVFPLDLEPVPKRKLDNARGPLHADAKLWGAWAFGDVYGFILEDEQGRKLENTPGITWPLSCWGFYGSDHEESGLLDNAREQAQGYLDYAAEEKAEAAHWAARDSITVAA